jgi:hypothetical protein
MICVPHHCKPAALYALMCEVGWKPCAAQIAHTALWSKLRLWIHRPRDAAAQGSPAEQHLCMFLWLHPVMFGETVRGGWTTCSPPNALSQGEVVSIVAGAG